MNRLKKKLFSLLGAFTILLLATPVVHAAPTDIQGHWAESAIKSLVQNKTISGYPDGSFKPDQSITRAEFATILSKAYGLKSTGDVNLNDINYHWAKTHVAALADHKIITGYPDGTFKPERPITRAEMATMLTRLIKLGNPEQKFSTEIDQSFPDIKSDFWAFPHVEYAARLGILPAHYQPEFQPTRLASRADTAWMVHTLRNLKMVEGKVLNNADGAGFLTVQAESGDVENVILFPDTIVFRNNLSTTMDKVQRNDTVTLYADRNGDYRIAKTFGKVTQDDLLGQISSMTKGRINPSQVTALLTGDWNSVTEEIKGEIYERLMDFGLTPAEAESVLVQDWQYMDTLSRDRLSEVLSDYLGITEDLGLALLDRDMDRTKEYARVELANIALNQLIQRGGLGALFR